jgi:transposase
VDSGKLGQKETKMPRTRPAYPEEYRAQILELIRAGRTPRELADEFEPSATTIRNWVKQAEIDGGQRHDGMTSEEKKELARLRRENKQLRMEREILAKAAAWFARETDSVPPKSSSS